MQFFFMVPTPVLVQAIKYCLAEAAVRFSIELHAFCFLSNHYHLVLTDPHQTLPAFMAHFNRNLAKCINAYLKRKGCVWEPGSYNAVVLTDTGAILEKIAYTIANPVAAGLVSTASQWPGLISIPEQFGTSETVARPALFFREDGTAPEEVSLTLCRPKTKDPSEAVETDREWTEAVAARLQEREEEIRSEFQAKGRAFAGVKSVLSTSPHDRPRSRDSDTGDEKDGIRPRVAGRNASLRRKTLNLLKDFVNAYREALAAFKQGVKDVVFPAGTYKMRILFGVRCAPVPEFS